MAKLRMPDAALVLSINNFIKLYGSLSLQRIFLEGIEDRREITLSGVWQQYNDTLAFILRALGNLCCCKGCRS